MTPSRGDRRPMEALVHAMLSNAVAAAGLALIPAVLSLTRAGRSPALIHGLWLLVLLKLVTPPLVTIPLDLPGSTPPAAVAGFEPGAAAASGGEVETQSEPSESSSPGDSSITPAPAGAR